MGEVVRFPVTRFNEPEALDAWADFKALAQLLRERPGVGQHPSFHPLWKEVHDRFLVAFVGEGE